jgi:hypothetical protein
MAEQPSLPVPDQFIPDPDPAATVPASSHSDTLRWLYPFGLLVLAGAIFLVWWFPKSPATDPGQLSETRSIEQKLDAVDSRVGRLEQAPAPPSAADLGKLSARLDVLEARISDQTQLSTRFDGLSARIESLSGRDQSAMDAIKRQVDGISAQVSTQDKAVASINDISARITRIARVQAAQLALAAGQPVGNVPNAPPALSRYADADPPTEAQLRLAFPQIERGAITLAQPIRSNDPFLDRAWEKAQALITIRQGNQVVVGDASAVALAQARAALDAGDLAAAVKYLSTAGPEVQKLASDWLTKARDLLAARSALADLAAHT